MVIVGLVLPTLSVIVTFTAGNPSTRGFGQMRFPPILCTSLQRDPKLYSLVLPINILLAIGVPLLIIIFHSFQCIYIHTCPQSLWSSRLISSCQFSHTSIQYCFLAMDVDLLWSWQFQLENPSASSFTQFSYCPFIHLHDHFNFAWRHLLPSKSFINGY